MLTLAALLGSAHASLTQPPAGIVLPARGLCAHRGDMSTHPENTLAAFHKAILHGAQMIEFDVQLSRDKIPVIMHDATVNRTTDGRGRISDLTLAEIRALDAGSWMGAEFAGERVPTLTEALRIMPANVWLNLHLKSEDADLGRRVAELVVAEGRAYQAFLACGEASARGARTAVPEILICNMNRGRSGAEYAHNTIRQQDAFIQLVGRMTPDFRGLVDDLTRAGVHVNYYGADDDAEVAAAFQVGVEFVLVEDAAATMPVAIAQGIAPLEAVPPPAATVAAAGSIGAGNDAARH